MNYQITASIVLYNNPKVKIRKAIESFLKTNMKIKLFLIDNSPNDILRNLNTDTRIEYIFNNRNIGFGAAHNIILKKIINKSEFHLVLNPDVFFEKNVIESIYHFMHANKNIGLVIPKILNLDKTIQYLPKLLPTPLDFLIRWFPFTRKIKDKRNNKYELRFADYTSFFEIPIISGCFTFINTNILKKGLFYDERFFMYFEDFDLSRRVNKNFKTIYFPDVEIIHEYERGARHNMKLTIIFIKSLIRYFNKWGWFNDKEREYINKRTIQNIRNHKL